MQKKHVLNWFWVAFLSLGLAASSVLAGKGGKDGGKNGGGGDDGSSDPPVLPPFSYAVDVVPVEGLDSLYDVNDWGQCAAMVDVSVVSAPIDTVEVRAAVVVDTISGQVSYLDNLIDPSEPWDLYTALAINNRGQIVGTGVKNGVFVPRAYLLNPRSDGSGYDLVDLGVDGTASWAREISHAGDVLMEINDAWMVVMSDGTVSPLPSVDRSYWGINSLGMLLGGYLVEGSTASLTGEMFYSNFAGTATTLDLLPYMTKASEPVLSESGFSFGKQNGPYQKIKGKEVGGSKVVTYDPMHSATEVTLNFNINANLEITAQVVDGVPLIAGSVGSGESSDIHRKPWIRFPGYDAFVISDLMDDTQKENLELLNLGYPMAGESDADFLITTPRDENGLIIHDGAPSLYGKAYHDSTFEGIYSISPILVP